MNIEQITEKFIRECPSHYRSMSEATHSLDPLSLNPYHLEDNIWTHTMMVVNYAKHEDYCLGIQIAALLHDLGKPFIWEKTANGRKAFHGHEGYGAFLAIGFLKSLKKEMPELDIAQICNLIADHSVFYRPIYDGKVSKKSKDKLVKRFIRNPNHLEWLSDLNSCDRNGSLSFTDQEEEIMKLTSYVMSEIDCGPRREWKDDNEIVIMIGPPGAGKSTFINSFFKDSNFFVLSRDEIIMEMGEGDNYAESWKTADQKLVSKIFNERLMDLKNHKRNIIIDMTMMGRKSRRRILSQFNDYYKSAVCFYTEFGEMLVRNRKRNREEGKHIPYAVMKDMVKRFEPPMFDEFDEIKNIVQ